VVFSPVTAAAQRLAAEFPTSRESSPAPKPARVKVGDYRYMGMVTLAVVGAAVGTIIAAKSCNDSVVHGPAAPGTVTTRSCGHGALYVFVGVGGGGALGYILGRNTPKWAPATP
jgi:hypothetical protein